MKKKFPELVSRVQSRAISDIENNHSEIKDFSSDESQFEFHVQITLRQIADIYSELNPDADPDSYLNDFFLPLVTSDIDPYEVLGGERLELPTVVGQLEIYRPMIATVLFCNTANNLHKIGSIDIAWAMLVEASFWCGIASVGDKMFDLSKLAVREFAIARFQGQEQSLQSKQGKVIELFKTMAPDTKWPSATTAAATIQEHIVRTKPAAFPRLSDGARGQRTIMAYIKVGIEEDPELNQLLQKPIAPGRPRKS